MICDIIFSQTDFTAQLGPLTQTIMKKTILDVRPSIQILGILFLTTLAFSSTLKNDFVNWDDAVFLTNNPYIQTVSPKTLEQICLKPIQGRFYPLTFLTFMIEYRFFKLQPFFYHLDNLILHLLNVFLVFTILRHLGLKPAVCGMTTLLFAIHPLQVESVAWVSSRKDVLFSFFYLSAIFCYLKSNSGSVRNRSFYILMYACFFLALISKPMAVTFPIIILVIEYFRKTRLTWDDVAKILPMTILGLFFGFLTLTASHLVQGFEGCRMFPFMDRFYLSNYFIFMYLKKILVPYPLSCIYPIPAKFHSFFPLGLYLPSLWVVPLVLAGILWRRSRIPVLFSLVTLFPVLHLIVINTSLFFERFTYLPSLGIFLLISAGLTHLHERMRGVPKMRFIIPVLFTVVILTLAALTVERCRIWKNSEILWTDVIRQFPFTPKAYINRADFYLRDGKKDLAFKDLTRAIAVDPDYASPYYGLGLFYQDSQDYSAAIDYYTKAIERDPTFVEAYNNRGNVYSSTGRPELAIQDYNRALEIDKNDIYAYLNRGIEYYHKGELETSLNDFLRVLSLQPDNIFAQKMCRLIIKKQHASNARREKKP